MSEDLEELTKLPGEYVERLEKALDKIKKDEVEAEEAINYFKEPFMEEFFPRLMKIEGTSDGISRLIDVMKEISGREMYVRMEGVEESKIFKVTPKEMRFPTFLLGLVRVFPVSIIRFFIKASPEPMEIEPVDEEEVRENPGIEINIKAIPPIVRGDMDQIFGTLSEKEMIVVRKAPDLVEWFNGEMNMAKYEPLLDLFEIETIKEARKLLLPTLDKSLKKFGV